MERRALLRASDADRERVADRLRAATAEGRLSDEELEDRLRSTYAARTYGELDSLLDDLPAPAAPPAQRGQRGLPARARPVLALAALAAILTAAMHGAGHHGAAAPNQHHHLTDPIIHGPIGVTSIHNLVVLAAGTLGVLAVVVVIVLVLTGVASRLVREALDSISPSR